MVTISKTYCDGCDGEMTPMSVVISPAIRLPKKEQTVTLQLGPPPGPDIHICLHCVIDAFKALDDRVRP